MIQPNPLLISTLANIARQGGENDEPPRGLLGIPLLDINMYSISTIRLSSKQIITSEVMKQSNN